MRELYDDAFAHVIARGVGRMILFEDTMDYKYYISLLRDISEETGVKIMAYCLMDNHVHLLVRYAGKNLSEFMKRMGITYSKYFNRKYDRTGHVFQGRYKMENVLDGRYFLTVTRYILQNPEKAGICNAKDYRWSSFWGFDSPMSFVDNSVAIRLLGGNDMFYRFVVSPADDECLEYTSDEIRDEEGKEEEIICDI